MTKSETIFAHELSLIHDKDIKQFVIECFNKLCPDYFWTCPYSTTGKYHPQVSLGVGGLVRHTKLAVWWGLELLNALGSSPGLYDIPPARQHDEVIATLLLHDMIKNGKGLNTQGYPLDRSVTGTHGVTLAEKIRVHPNIYLNNADSFYRILAGIALHMGIWTTIVYNTIKIPGIEPFIDLIHLADYCASRKVDEIYRKLQGEQDVITQNPTKETPKSPACLGVRSTESCQTTTAENGQ
jgi:hypothetical protein